MSAIGLDRLPPESVGLRLCKIFPGDDLRLCEAVRFINGRDAVNTVLRRGGISGRVEVDPEGDLPDHFADVMDENGNMIANVALDAKSFRSLKTHWMRCKYEGPPK